MISRGLLRTVRTHSPGGVKGSDRYGPIVCEKIKVACVYFLPLPGIKPDPEKKDNRSENQIYRKKFI